MTHANTVLQFGSRIEPEQQSPQARTCPACERRFTGEAAFCPYDGERLADAGVRETPRDPLVGTVVDNRYRVLDVLGEGGMGTVYRVRHVALERGFALKAMRRELACEPTIAHRFILEAKAAAAVPHPGIVQITDFGTLPTGQPYFVMDLLRGRPLAQVIREEGRLPTHRAGRILRQIAEALGAAHDVGVIHRDLKPDNVVVDEGDQIKVLDFGLAKVVGGSKLTRSGMVFGTPHYMSPEQAAGETIDHRSDVYALGVLAYQMLTGHVPFEAETYMGVMSKHLHMTPPRPSDILPAGEALGPYEEVVMRCLEKDPAKRFQHMSDLVACLDQLARSYTAVSRPSSAGGARASTGRGRAVLAAAVVFGVVALVVSVVVAWRLGQRSRAASSAAPSSVSSASAVALPDPVQLAPPPEFSLRPLASERRPERAPVAPHSSLPRPAGSRSEPADPAVIGDIVDPWQN